VSLTGAAVDTPIHLDGLLRDRLSALHRSLAEPGDELGAESRLALVRERLLERLGARHFVRFLGVAPGRYARARA
jgi:hypothetical protein